MNNPQIVMSRWTHGQRTDTTNPAPNAEGVEVAVRKLNGRDLNDLYIYPDSTNPETYMAVGGGSQNRYLVFISAHNATFTQATNPDAADGEAELVIGGQPGRHALKHLIGLEAAIDASTHFLATGLPTPSLTWEQL